MRDSEIAQAKTAVHLLSGHIEDMETASIKRSPEPTFTSDLDIRGVRRVPEQS